MDLFTSQAPENLPGTPLAERLRPQNRTGLLGQPQVLAQVNRYISSGNLPSLIFWGPPGTGKTTLAQALAQEFKAQFISLNAIEGGSKILKEIGDQARMRRLQFQTQTILFIDEIHRFNKTQQDILLPFIEKGDLILIGATTENPSYELNRALMSRCRLLVFERHTVRSLTQLVQTAFAAIDLEPQTVLSPEAQTYLVTWADGDARRLLLGLEEIFSYWQSTGLDKPENQKIPENKKILKDQKIFENQNISQKQKTSENQKIFDVEMLIQFLGQTPIGYDKQSDQHYDSVSAFIKSIRGSDADAALYYLARMLKGGENPLFIARRLVILASEDIGNADPRALQVAISGMQAVELIGLPEGSINLAQVVTYLSSAPKSNRSYLALKKAQDYVEKTGTSIIPLSLRSSKNSEYQYPHDFPKAWVEQSYWPEGLKTEKFYDPANIGFEKQIKEYLKWLKS